MSSGKTRKIIQQLNGKICLIAGNHESSARDCASDFEWIKDYYELTVDDQDAHNGKRFIVLFHYAMRVWNASHYGTWHLYGHSHGDLPDDPNSLSIDVGVDIHNFYPLSYEDVKKIMSLKTWVPPFAPRNKQQVLSVTAPKKLAAYSRDVFLVKNIYLAETMQLLWPQVHLAAVVNKHRDQVRT